MFYIVETQTVNFISFVHGMGIPFLVYYYFVGVLINRIIFTELSVIRMEIITVTEGLAKNSDDRNLKSFFVLFLASGLHTSGEL
jgi:hypothetical protein